MTRGKRIKMPLFPAHILIYVSDDPMSLIYPNKKKIFDNFTHNKFARGCVVCNDTVKGFIECIIFIHELNPDHLMQPTIVHECEHAKDFIIEKIGLETGDTELNAYILDWIYTQVSNFVLGSPKKTSHRWKG
jgi:hypothetical protein